ncbi:MAG: FixH family protein [Acidobacteriia bacterium]|nr:FixH family protein [Terriglobia bacterium]
MRILVIPLAIPLFAALLFSSACRRQQPQSGSTKQTADAKHFSILQQSSKELGWRGILSLAPMPAESGKETSFTLKLVAPDGAPIDRAHVRMALIMPLMDMGKEEFGAPAAGNGVYLGKGTISMDGVWIVQANIERDNQKARLEFEIHVNVP